MSGLVNEHLSFINVLAWRNAGFTGRGIKVWVAEGNGDHGQRTLATLLSTAPGVETVLTGVGRHIVGGQLISATVDGVNFDKWTRRERPDIISVSLTGNRNQGWTDLVDSMQRELNFSIFNAAGNDGNQENNTIRTSFPEELSIVVGALQWSNGRPRRANFSSIGEALDFMQIQGGIHQGTSFATPTQAGMAAMIMQRYGKMSQQELFNYLRFIAVEPPSDNIPGHDIWYGWGQPILPALRRRYITMTTNSNTYHVDGVAHEMDTKPVNIEGNVFVPVRAVAEALNKDVSFNAISNGVVEVTIRGNGTTVNLTTGSDIMTVNGRKVVLNFAPFIDENSRTLVPIRAIAEAFRCQVNWVQQDAKVMILES